METVLGNLGKATVLGILPLLPESHPALWNSHMEEEHGKPTKQGILVHILQR